MKKLLILLFSILISFNSYGQTICFDTVNIKKSDGIIYYPNWETKPFTGKNLCKYENGQIMVEVNYKDGKKDAKETWWYENGQKESEVNYKDGKGHGMFTAWHENGQKELEGNYKDGKEDGKETYWHENGQIMVETYYRDGKEEFSNIIFYD